MTVNNTSVDDLPEAEEGVERRVLQPQEELRIEVDFKTSSNHNPLAVTLQKGSCECWGCELAVGKTYEWTGGLKIALFTWHGCVIDVLGEVEMSYTSDETDCNVAYVNTHAQLEALRDQALQQGQNGPRVLVVGPPESGKSSLCKTLVAYACKVGRTPLWLDLDPVDNALSVPGSLAVAPMTAAAVTVDSFAQGGGIPPNQGVFPLVLWHGDKIHPDLFKAQVDRMATNIHARMENDENAKASGLIVNTNGWIQDDGFELLLHAAKSLEISVILILGHDRLYSMMNSHYKKNSDDGSIAPKVLKLPRSGGVVSRSPTFRRHAQSRAVKRYFYGDMVNPPAGGDSTTKVPQLTPFLVQLPTGDAEVFKLSSMALSSSLLPVAQQQSTDAIQIQKLQGADANLQHALLAVCHPHAVSNYQSSGNARDLVTAGVAGFCAVERVLTDSDTWQLLSPCAGELPSKTLLWGDITWME